MNFEARLLKALEDHSAQGYDCGNCPAVHVECACEPLVAFNDAHLLSIVKPVLDEFLTDLSDRIGKAADELAMLSAKNSGDERVRLTGKATGASLAQGYVQELIRENA